MLFQVSMGAASRSRRYVFGKEGRRGLVGASFHVYRARRPVCVSYCELREDWNCKFVFVISLNFVMKLSGYWMVEPLVG